MAREVHSCYLNKSQEKLNIYIIQHILVGNGFRQGYHKPAHILPTILVPEIEVLTTGMTSASSDSNTLQSRKKTLVKNQFRLFRLQ